jgi:uncharacterized protein (DUF952 family)
MSAARLFHVAFADDWEAMTAFGTYESSTRQRTVDEEGFLHVVEAGGIPAALRIYADLSLPLLLIELSEEGLNDAGIAVEWIEDADGARRPRVLGALPTVDPGVIVATYPLTREADHWLMPQIDSTHPGT